MRNEGIVEKGWGRELIFATNDKYCGKLLMFEKAGNKFSMHFHNQKDETWFVLKGSFKLITLNTETANLEVKELKTGDIWRNMPLQPHQLEAQEDDCIVIEVSTPDSVEDNYRILQGDSQNRKK